jgi:glutamyl-tRNA reductase
MSLVCLGISHHEAPAEVRERHAFPAERMAEALVALRDYDSVLEAAMLSTCNRLEIYAEVEDPDRGVAQLKEFLVNFRHSDVPFDLEPYLYTLHQNDAIVHMMRVATGLDSMLIGEAEILGQVKEAYFQAQRANAVGKTLHRLFREAINAGKAARSTTCIGNESVSIATLAITLAREHVGELAGKNILLIGAGKMARTAAKRLKLEGAHAVVILNRTLERAAEIVHEIGTGTPADLSSLDAALATADIVISSTGALHFVVTPEHVSAAMSGRPDRPLFLVDIAVPRDIDPAVTETKNVRLTDIDRLSETIDVTLEHRQQAIPLVEQIIEAHVMQFEFWYRSNATENTVSSLARKAEAMRDLELERLFARCPTLDKRQRMLVTGLSRRIVSKLLHPAIVSMRGTTEELLAESVARAHLIEEIFALTEAVAAEPIEDISAVPARKRNAHADAGELL